LEKGFSMDATATSNRHPVDQLADVRERIKTLQTAEEMLKALITTRMGTADSLGGDEFIARQAISERKGGLDEKAMKAAGIDTDKFRKPSSTVISLRLERRAGEQE
jgi:uncharacterized protein (UPF0335 family)